MQKISTEVLIAGCGPVGLALANCLAKSSYVSSITLLDRKMPFKNRVLPQVPSQRVFSINGPSLKLLDNLHALPLIRQKGFMSQVQVVSKQSLSFVHWAENNANVIQNDQLVYSLYNSLNSHSKIRFVEEEITKINRDNDYSAISLKKLLRLGKSKSTISFLVFSISLQEKERDRHKKRKQIEVIEEETKILEAKICES